MGAQVLLSGQELAGCKVIRALGFWLNPKS